MEDKQKELSSAISTDTSKLSLGQKDIGKAISNDGSKILDKNQIPVYLDKREKELGKKRSNNI